MQIFSEAGRLAEPPLVVMGHRAGILPTPKRAVSAIQVDPEPPVIEDDGWVKVPGTFPYPRPEIFQVPTIFVKEPNVVAVHSSGRAQFRIDTQVTSDGVCKTLRVLADTGAEPNLVQKGIFPEDLFFEAKKPILLAGANKAGIAGGVRQIHLMVTFQDENGHKVALPGDFYEAEISVPLILSNRWMGENHLLLEPESNCILQRRGRKLETLLPLGCSSCHDTQDDRQGCSRVSAGQGS